MLKKIVVMCAALVIDVFCLEMPEAGVTYQISGETLVKAADIFQKRDLGVFALCYKNYQNNFNQDYLESVFNSISRLNPKMSACVTLVIDDDSEEVLAEIADLIRVCKQFNKWNIPVYINWNGGNLKIQKSRDNLLELIRLFGTKYILLADSDDILHPDCLPIMYQTMENNENLYLLLGEYSLLGYLNNRPKDIEPYKNKQLNLDNFKLKLFFENSSCGNNQWNSIGNKPLAIKKTSSSPNKGNGYLPAIIRNFDQIPVKCCERDGNMLCWFGDIVKVLEDIKPNSESNRTDVRKDLSIKGDPQYAVLTPSDEESFLYFYRLYSQSHSHKADKKVNDLEILRYFTQTICFLSREDISTEDVLAGLIKEVCPLQNMISYENNNFDFDNLLAEYIFIKSTIGNKADLIKDYIHSFWKMVLELRNGDVDGAKKWINQFDNKDREDDISLFCSLNIILDGYFEYLKEEKVKCKELQSENSKS